MTSTAPNEVSFGPRQFPRLVYWRFRQNRQAAAHMLAVLLPLARNALRLVVRARLTGDHRPVVAIALTEHMGDIVAAEPIARLARRRFPEARIVWITRAPYAVLVESHPDVDHVVVVTCLTEWMLLRRLGLFDVVWDLHLSGRVCPTCQVPQLKSGIAANLANYFDFGSLLDVQCDSAGLPRLNEGPRLTPPPAAVAAVDDLGLPAHFIVIHCESNDRLKDWPTDKWRDLVARLVNDEGLTVVEVGHRPLVIDNDGARQRSLGGKLSVVETAAVIQRADLFIGIDSGPAHLASAVSTTGVILLGAYANFRSYMPYSGGYASGGNADIIRAVGPVAELSVEEVFSAVMSRVTATTLMLMMADRKSPIATCPGHQNNTRELT